MEILSQLKTKTRGELIKKFYSDRSTIENNIDDKMDTSIENDSQNIEDDIEKENKDS